MKPVGGSFFVPEDVKKWTIHEIQVWCRGKLDGAPPAKPIDSENGLELKWNEVKLYTGKKIKLHSNFKGLIINNKFEMAYTAPMTVDGETRKQDSSQTLDNITDPDKLINLQDVNARFWSSVKDLVDWYNVEKMRNCHTGEMMWRAGKEMDIIQQTANEKLDLKYVAPVNLYYSIQEWGIGHEKNGYGKQQLQKNLEMYQWLGNSSEKHPIMKHRTNPIMKLIMMEGSDRTRRMNMFTAYDSGPLKGLSDQKFGWAIGMSENTFPTPGRWNDLQSLREKIAKGEDLSEGELVNLQSIMQDL